MIRIYVSVGLGIFALILFVVGRKQAGRASAYNQYIEATRASELGAGIPAFFGGVVAVADGQTVLTAPYSKQACVWYHFVVEQEQVVRDSNGAESVEWRVVSQPDASGVRFQLVPESGSTDEAVLVDPANADVDRAQQFEQFIAPMNAEVGGAMGVIGAIVNTANALGEHKTRVRESYIAVGQHLNAGGVSTEVQARKIFANDGHYPLVLTTQSRADLVKSGRKTSTIEYVVGAVLSAAAAAVFILLKK